MSAIARSSAIAKLARARVLAAQAEKLRAEAEEEGDLLAFIAELPSWVGR